ncbi:MAG: nitroreductase/quinone reductase family protein [Pseudomonadota bacterium]
MGTPPFDQPTAAAIELSPSLPDWIHAHVQQYLTDPAAAHDWDARSAGGSGVLPTLLLLTRGRRSGKTLTLPLIYKQIGDDFVVIASKGGAPAHPAWFLNLETEARCAIQVGPAFHQGVARVLAGQQRAAAWKEMATLFPPYDSYQERAGGREIPVVAIQPAG